MRFIYQLLLGFIIFDFMLVMFAPFFNTPMTSDSSIKKINETLDKPEIADYKQVTSFGGIVGLIINGTNLAIIGAVMAGGFLAKWISGGSINTMLLIGIGLFIAMITILWNAASKAMANLNPYNDSNIGLFLTAITICIGILLMFSVIELFTGQQGVDS